MSANVSSNSISELEYIIDYLKTLNWKYSIRSDDAICCAFKMKKGTFLLNILVGTLLILFYY